MTASNPPATLSAPAGAPARGTLPLPLPTRPPTTHGDSAWRSPQEAPTPFWQRVPKFFLLPLQRPALVRIISLAAAAMLAPLALYLGFSGLLILALAGLAIVVVGTQFGFTIIERSSQGFLQTSDYPSRIEGSSLARPFKYFAVNAIFLGLVIAAAMIARGSQLVAWLAWTILFTVAMPAAVMRLVMTGSLRAALNPLAIAAVISKIGKPYIALVIFLFFADLCRSYGTLAFGLAGGIGAGASAMANGAAGGAAQAAAKFGAGMMATLFFVSLGFWYFTYMICALIGYAMFQFADALDITIVGPGESRYGRPGTRRDIDVAARARDALIAKMVAAGEIREAIDLLNDDLRTRPNDLSLRGRLHKLLLIEGYQPRIDDHTEKYLDLLMKTDNAREALPLIEEALKRKPTWEPRDLAHVVPLARAALAANKPQLTAQLIRGFDKKHRMHPDIPYVYLIAGQLMIASGGGPERARPLLQAAAEQFASHPAGQEAKRTLDRLAQITRTPTRPA